MNGVENLKSDSLMLYWIFYLATKGNSLNNLIRKKSNGWKALACLKQKSSKKGKVYVVIMSSFASIYRNRNNLDLMGLSKYGALLIVAPSRWKLQAKVNSNV